MDFRCLLLKNRFWYHLSQGHIKVTFPVFKNLKNIFLWLVDSSFYMYNFSFNVIQQKIKALVIYFLFFFEKSSGTVGHTLKHVPGTLSNFVSETWHFPFKSQNLRYSCAPFDANLMDGYFSFCQRYQYLLQLGNLCIVKLKCPGDMHSKNIQNALWYTNKWGRKCLKGYRPVDITP